VAARWSKTTQQSRVNGWLGLSGKEQSSDDGSGLTVKATSWMADRCDASMSRVCTSGCTPFKRPSQANRYNKDTSED
jgi:hypothetical protein